jgi:hypothetical protein
MRETMIDRLLVPVVLLFSIFVASTCAMAADDNDIAKTYDKYLKLCTESLFPNSMARPEGFDLEKHLQDVKTEKDKTATKLNAEEALKYIESRAAVTKDDVEKECAAQLLKKTKRQRKTANE